MSAQFNILRADPASVARLQRELGLPRFIATTIVARGIEDIEEARRFLNPDLDRDWIDPYAIDGLSAVVDDLEHMIRSGKHILVFGDFDVDGITATAALTLGLRELGAHVTPFIPLRFEEGYGLTEASLKRVFALQPDYIITVDCGIACKHEVEMVKAAGIGIAITDHHEPMDLVPVDVPIANPKLDPDCPSFLLAGVGVALKVLQATGARLGKPHLWREYIDLAILGTVADLMPMVGENRALVTAGLERINTAPRAGIAALLETTGASDRKMNATNIGFTIIPRLNAAGRLGDARPALDLLLSQDFEEAGKRAAKLEEVNDKRRLLEAELSEAATAQASEIYQGQRVLVVADEGWHEGVKGIVASRLVNRYGVPVLLFSIEGDEARGSCRSVGQVNLLKGIESVADLLIRFGGHEAAAGVTLPAAKLTEFTERLQAYMQQLPAESFYARVQIDSCVDLEELTLDKVMELERLAPFGQENPTPQFLARGVTLTDCRAVGAAKNHFSCALSDGKNKLSGIMFNCPDIKNLMACDSVVNAAFELQIDEWKGRRSVKAIISTLAPPQVCVALEACLNPEHLSFMADLFAVSSEEDRETMENLEDDDVRAEQCERSREYWRHCAQENVEALDAAIVETLIGDKDLYEAQREVLDLLAQKESVLAVMPTARGKSLAFFVHATREALLHAATSVFVYPLRALIADQSFHMNEALEAFGIRIATLTGESSSEERDTVFKEMREGVLDIVLTTPEFLSFHANEFSRASDIGFVVVDEAHHIGLSQAGKRIAYVDIASTVERIGHPVVLALTATAPSPIAQEIITKLDIRHCVCDGSVRHNLNLADQRNLKNRASYVANLVAGGEKAIIYVNSRQQSIALARELRKLVPQVASLIGFYNAGLSRTERRRIEELFRTDALCILIATSAFGEGVDIAHIRHVVLYHLPFNEVEFNQISGRAGRDGGSATVHVLFGRDDAKTNEGILHDTRPDHDHMAQMYRTLRSEQRAAGESFFVMDAAGLAAAASADKRFPISQAAAECGIAVFAELGLIETRTAGRAGEVTHSIRVNDCAGKVELTDSVRYREGDEEREIFHAFRDWALKGSQEALHGRISRAILPKTKEVDESVPHRIVWYHHDSEEGAERRKADESG